LGAASSEALGAEEEDEEVEAWMPWWAHSSDPGVTKISKVKYGCRSRTSLGARARHRTRSRRPRALQEVTVAITIKYPTGGKIILTAEMISVAIDQIKKMSDRGTATKRM